MAMALSAACCMYTCIMWFLLIVASPVAIYINKPAYGTVSYIT